MEIGNRLIIEATAVILGVCAPFIGMRTLLVASRGTLGSVLMRRENLLLMCLALLSTISGIEIIAWCIFI